MRTVLFWFCLCLFASRGGAATADIQISSDHTPETTSQTVGSPAVVGTVSTLNFPGNAIVNYSVQETSIWSITPTTGILSRKADVSINLEAPTLSLLATVTATQTNGSTTATKAFTIIIDNVNEPPNSTSFATGGSIAENATGTVGTLQATDPDAGDTVSYSTNDGRFQISGTTLSLRSGNALDFETTPTTTVDITATDNHGGNSLSTTTTLTITVTNANEAPGVASFATGGSIAENATGTVGTLQATDPDAGDTVSFSTTDARFQISGTTLSLKAGNALDFEATLTTTVAIIATDNHGANSLATTTTLTITITNVNEAPGAASFATGGSIAENATGVVGTLQAADPDAGDAVSYSTNDGRFQISGTTLLLKAGNALDFETTLTTTVAIIATDNHGANSLATTTTLTITVTNVNEAPGAASFATGGSIAENATGVVGTLQATDPDAGDSIAFSTNDSRFQISGITLSLKAGSTLDFETTPTTTVAITAKDTGNLSITKTLTVTVTNVNERPTTVSFLTGGSIAENAAGFVGTLTANDPENGTLTFATTDPRFTITGNTLSALANQLDFETSPTTNVNIQVTDSGTGSGTVTLTLAVNITNVNERPTTVSFLTGGSVAENAAAPVGTLTANDPENER